MTKTNKKSPKDSSKNSKAAKPKSESKKVSEEKNDSSIKEADFDDNSKLNESLEATSLEDSDEPSLDHSQEQEDTFLARESNNTDGNPATSESDSTLVDNIETAFDTNNQDLASDVNHVDSQEKSSVDDIDWDDFSFGDFGADDVLGKNAEEDASESNTETPIDMSEVTEGFGLHESESSEVFSDDAEVSTKDELSLMVEDKLDDVKAFVEENKSQVQIGVGVIVLLLFIWLFSSSDESSQLEEITKVTEQATNIDNELKRFEAEFSQLSVDGSNKVSELDNKVSVLFETIKDNKEELAEQKKALNELTISLKQLIEQRKTSSYNKKIKNKIPSFTITAIVPGRVWLRSENGEEFTATVGDELKDLGVIVKIEPHYGRIQTSSGTVIRLGEYDG